MLPSSYSVKLLLITIAMLAQSSPKRDGRRSCYNLTLENDFDLELILTKIKALRLLTNAYHPTNFKRNWCCSLRDMAQGHRQCIR